MATTKVQKKTYIKKIYIIENASIYFFYLTFYDKTRLIQVVKCNVVRIIKNNNIIFKRVFKYIYLSHVNDKILDRFNLASHGNDASNTVNPEGHTCELPCSLIIIDN